ncbi:hypothetical protein [Lacinutrix chionoecetis]
MEAIKEENTVIALISGTVKTVSLKEGSMVKQDDLVVTVE